MPKILLMSEFQTRMEDCESMIRICRMPQSEALAYITKHVLGEVNRTTGKVSKRKVYSDYMRGFVTGLEHAMFSKFYRQDLEFCYVVDGVFYSTHADSVHRKTEEFYSSNRGYVLSNAKSGHVWKGTEKFYYSA